MGHHLFAKRVRPGAPLLVTFHGTGGAERDFAGLAADRMPGATHIAPRGDVREGGALRFFRRRAEGLHDLADLARRSAAMAGFVAAQKPRLRPARTVGPGCSNGANMLASVAFPAPGRFDAAIRMHPRIPFRPGPSGLAGLAVPITAGRRDPVAPAAATGAPAGAFAADGAAA